MFVLLALHLVVGVSIIAAGRVLGRRAFLVAAIPAVAMCGYAIVHAGGVLDGTPVTESYTWISGLDLAIDLRLDAFALAMVALVSGIGVLICVYSLGYFAEHHDERADHDDDHDDPPPAIGRLAGVMVLFAGSMLGVVLTDHLIALFIFWELTSVTSFLLIGNDDRQPRARVAANQAIFITGAGGLVLLAGLILIGQAGGTFRLSELAANPPTGGLVNAGLVCVLIGAFTKSAQAPFSSWLPMAMVAPTPISAYLHSATMVKAGVYLVARLAPLFALDGAWRPLVLTVGAVTMVIGGLRSMRQHDLKLLLAYGTVSQLGFMMLLFGAGEYHIAEAGIVLLLAHAAFKAALFMVVGIIDHTLGTRDIRHIGRLGPGWRPVLIVGVISAASMAGVPPLLGFISKEKALDGYLEHADFTGGTAVLTVIVVASVFTFAYSARFVLGLFGMYHEGPLDDAAADSLDHGAAAHHGHTPTVLFWAPAALLAAFTLAAGIAPVIVDHLVEAATIALYPGTEPKPVELWSGFTAAFALSLVIIWTGIALAAARAPVEEFQRRASKILAPLPSGEEGFVAVLAGITGTARRVTATLQNGSLPIYVAVIVLVAILAPLTGFATAFESLPEWVGTPVHVVIVVIITAAALGASIVRHRIAAALMLGAVGYAMAGLYVAQGAPDLALTQFSIETLSTVLFVLVLRFLPRSWSIRAPAIANPLRLAVSAIVGVGIFIFAIVASESRDDVPQPSMSEEMVDAALPEGKGHNVVNIILVDFRGWDTMGEISVLVVAAVGAVSLARMGRRRSDRDAPVFEEEVEVGEGSSAGESDPDAAGAGAVRPRGER
ncbi:MAG: hydrogen gas-evolving membrane-bound hydrogenase subunit E [Actinomycetota bacterium]